MKFRTDLLVGVTAISFMSATVVQAQAHPAGKPTAPTVRPQTPAKTTTTTTQSTTSATAVPDAAGDPVAVQKTTDTTQTTTTQPATPASPPTSQTTSTTTVAPDATGTPTATTTTTTSEPAKDQTGAAVTAATADDVKAGVPVFDSKGGVVGKVDSVSASGAVVNTGTVKASIPVASFGKNDKGLVVSMTKAEINAAAKTSAPKKK